jgi:hypothetical protein
MTFQSTVSLQQGFGVPGELYNDSPFRSQSFILNSASAAYNIVGATVCTITAQGTAEAGGTGIFAGFLVDPKVYALQGTLAGGTLAPSLVLPNYTQVELLTMGSIVVTLPGAAAIGDVVIYNTTTGAISTQSPSTAVPGGSAYAFAVVDYFTVAGAGLGVITVSPQQNVYVPV